MDETRHPAAPFDSDEHYLRLRLKLIWYFERRKCATPEDLADECLNRVLVYTRDHGKPTTLEKLSFGFAQNVFFEYLRISARIIVSPEDLPERAQPSPSAEESRLLAQFSVGRLDAADRELLEQFYLDKRTADSLAVEWGLSPEGVRSRVFRRKRELMRILLEERARPQNERDRPKHK